jgi:polyhydroxyalkanoate synthesis regulator protein
MEEIVKYSNRKLYSRTESTYITLGYIKEMVQEGRTVVVKDHTGKDITDETLRKVATLTTVSAEKMKEIIVNN